MSDNAPSTSDPLRAVELLGRDTPAGKALYRLYNGSDVGRQKGQAHSERNKAIHEKKVASGWTPPPAESPPKVVRPVVAVPSFGHRKHVTDDRPKYIPHRKPGQLIQQEMQQEAQRQRNEQHAPAPGRLLDDAEKERLSKLMEFRGKVPEPPQAPPKRAPKTERQELQEMFDAVLLEIEERREFLRDLERAGGLKQDHVFQVRTEITERVQEMAKLDKMLKALDMSGPS